MKPLPLASLCLAGTLAIAGVSAGAATSTQARGAPAAPRSPVAAQHGGFLADSVVLARVGDRVIRVKDYVDGYFNSDPQYRPSQDSLGRVQFLNSMVNQGVMGITAFQLGRPLGFEDRATLRGYTDRTLSNVLYQRMVIDSIHVGDADIERVYRQFEFDIHLKRIQVPDRVTAERVRAELLQGRLPWSVAVRKYSVAADKDKDGDMGWVGRLGVSGALGIQMWDLAPGKISEPIANSNGYQIVQVVERRPATPPALEPLRGMIRDQIVALHSGERQALIQERLLATRNVSYDRANLAWAATRFQSPVSLGAGGGLEINTSVPEITGADRKRVLARYAGGEVTMDQLLEAYQAMPPVLRPSLTTPDAVKDQVDAVVLDPTMIQLARDRGLEKDPVAAGLIRKKEEELRVEHLFQDSIQAHVTVTESMRHKYYENNKKGFVTYPYVRYAAFSAHTKAGADSLKARLAHEKAEAILYADSLAGIRRGSIQERYQNQHGPYQKVLFEELRPGQTTVDGPDKQGDYLVLQLLAFDPGHQLTYAQVEQNVDESVRNIVADDLLQRFIARHERGMKIETHPELLMRVALHEGN